MAIENPHPHGDIFCQYCNGTGIMVVHIPEQGINMQEVKCLYCNRALSKEEAIQALKEGKKVRHRYFSDNEWMTLEPTGEYRFEDGALCSPELFWVWRKDQYWETDWFIV